MLPRQARVVTLARFLWSTDNTELCATSTPATTQIPLMAHSQQLLLVLITHLLSLVLQLSAQLL